MHLYDVGSEKASNKLATITTSNAIPCARQMEVVPPEIPAEMLVKNSWNISQNVQCELIANVFNNTWLIFLFISQHLKSLLSWLTKDVSEHQQHHTVRMPTIVPARRWCIQLMWVVKRHLRNSQQSPPAVPPPRWRPYRSTSLYPTRWKPFLQRYRQRCCWKTAQTPLRMPNQNTVSEIVNFTCKIDCKCLY